MTKQPGITDLKKKAILDGKGKSSRYFLREEATLGFEEFLPVFLSVQFTVTPFPIVFRLIMFHDRDGAQGLRP